MLMIGENSRIFRNRSGLSLTKVCALLVEYDIDISPSMLSALQRGERRFAAETVYALSKIYHCTLYDLYGLKEGRGE